MTEVLCISLVFEMRAGHADVLDKSALYMSYVLRTLSGS